MDPRDIRTGPGADMELPGELDRLRELAYNLWWTWSPAAHRLFHSIDSEHWALYRNPVELLINIVPERWSALLADPLFLDRHRSVLDGLDRYLEGVEHSWFVRTLRGDRDRVVAYFSTEYGWHEAMQSYSGGLGVLSGDHSKSASDLGLPFVGIGLAYRRGYFRQTVDFEGNQQHFYPVLDLARMPLRPLVGDDGNELRVPVDLAGRKVYVRVWLAAVGRVPVLLLDSDVDENDRADRPITSILYVQGREMRLCQEVLLGIGGVRVLETLGIRPSVWHMNEGHCALLSLERARVLVRDEGMSFRDALLRVADSALFTTHTPVPAGNETFDAALVRRYVAGIAEECGVDVEEVLDLGRPSPEAERDSFNLTALAIRASRRTNGVSELHGRVAAEMWQHLWGQGRELPLAPPGGTGRAIDHVTNGVHISTWLGAEIGDVLARHLGRGFMLNLLDPGFADAVRAIPDEELWDAHLAQKGALLQLVRDRVLDQFARYGRSPDDLRETAGLFGRDVLTIGFARRFATYKRATLLFRDAARLAAVLSSEERPVQVLFAGKAHPADRPGQDLIRQICRQSHAPGFKGRVLFLENYNMRLGRCMVQGVDVWLNNPRRPLEASGTSGMKAGINGVLNCSVLDGWWCEGFDPTHGWAIGDVGIDHDEHRQDEEDGRSLLDVLSREVVPSFYAVDGAGLPRAWIARMKSAIGAIIPRFSASRMVREYTERYFASAAVDRG